MKKKRAPAQRKRNTHTRGRSRTAARSRKALTSVKSISKTTADKDAKSFVGSFSRTDKGYGFVTSQEVPGGDLFVAPSATLGALSGDTVRVRLLSDAREGRRAECEVLEILSRAVTRTAGVYKSFRTHGEVYPIDGRVPSVYVPLKLSNGAKTGQLVAVRITDYGESGALTGRVEKRLGRQSEERAVYDAILYSYDIPTDFSRDALAMAESLSREITPDDITGRRDFRGERVFTIDGEYAKDFDDAVSIEKTSRGTYILGVHIADVSHYVRPYSAIDRDAFERGTSVYFTDKVIPMLPERLSNDICSLVPHEDRLTMSCVMEIDGAGEIIKYEICESVIRSAERLIYSDVSRIIDKEADDTLTARYAHIMPDLLLMDELRLILGERRMKRGALYFDLPEAYIELDENGEPVRIAPRERGSADNLIEEFMLCANETVARHMRQCELPSIYRTHAAPSPEKTDAFIALASLFGLPVPQGRRLTGAYLKTVIEAVKDKSFAPVVLSSMLRSLMKAEYDVEPKGHFGLALSDYCHFTSPIRRYPDLTVHRALKADIRSAYETRKRRMRPVKDAAAQSNLTETRAVDCTRAIDDLYKAIYMSKFVGDTFRGIIASVTNAGFFVELDNTVRGLVSMQELNDDYYIYDDKKMCLLGKHRGKKYQIGDIIEVRLIRTDIHLGRVDFSLD